MRLEKYFARKERQTGINMWNTNEVAGIKSALREEYFPRPKRVEPAPDTKVDEKFEPFFEGEGKEESSPIESEAQDSPAESS